MPQDTRPAALDPSAGPDAWAAFRVTQPPERLRLLRELRDGSVPVVLNAPDGMALGTLLWAVEAEQQRLNFSAEGAGPQLSHLVEANEATAVAYLHSVKLQFELHGFVLVHGARGASALHCRLPSEIYRFQRRNAFRVRSPGRPDAVARFRHPGLPEMTLALRVLDLSIGGCALWLPSDVPPLQAGTRLAEILVELDAETRFSAPATLQHVTSSIGGERGDRGVRIGCEWLALPSTEQRLLQRWIDRAQQRRRLLSLP